MRDKEEDKGGEESPVDGIHLYIKQIFAEQFLHGRHGSRDLGHSYGQGQQGSSPRCLMGQCWWWTGKHMETETNDQDTFAVIKKCFEACSDWKILLMIGWSRWLL